MINIIHSKDLSITAFMNGMIRMWFVISLIIAVLIAGGIEIYSIRKEYRVLQEHIDRLTTKMMDKERNKYGMGD